MEAFVRWVSWTSRLCGVLAAAMIALSVVVVCQMVFVRYALGHSTIWQTPFVTFLLIAATFVGSPYVLLIRGHVNVDVLPLYLPQRGRMVLAVLSALFSLAFCLVVLWQGGRFWYEVLDRNWMSSSIWRIPLWIPYLSLPLGFGLLCLQYVADLWCLVTGQALPFGLSAEDRP